MNKQLQSIRKLLMRGLGVGLLVAGGFLTNASAQVSVTATSGTAGPSPYTTVNDALAAITAGTHQGDVTITISANTTEPAFAAANQLVASGVGSANYTSVTIKPSGNVTVNSAATPTGSRGMLEFIGADKVTIDGDDPSTPGSRNLTFAMASSGTTYVSALRFSSSSTTAGSGCRDIVIKNCVIIGSRNSSTATGAVGLGITAAGNTSGTLASLTQNAYDNDNWLVENNYFLRAAYGFHAYGNSASTMDSLIIRNNKFGSDTSLQNIGLAAIYLGNTATTVNTGSVLIQGNEIQSGDYTSGLGTGNYGIYLNTGNAGATIRNNNIHDVANPSSGGWQAHGISMVNATGSDGIKIYNNMIRDMYAYHYSFGPTTYEGCGIYIADNYTNLTIVHNTIALTKPNAGAISTNNSSACVFVSSSAPTFAAFKNNILVNKQSDGPGQNCMGIYLYNLPSFSATSGAVDKNVYYTPGASGNVGYSSMGTHQSLASWKAACLKDSNSFSANPTFVSATNLRLQTGVKSPLESYGDLTAITTDYDGNVRPGPAGSIYGGGTAPDIGAHESDMLPDLFTADSARVTQVVQVIAPGDTSKAILNVKVYVSGSIGSLFNVNSLLFNTIGTTSAANIVTAKVFYTGSSATFSPATLYGSTASPSGSFAVTGTQTVGAGVHNFWLAYDVSGASVSGNNVDARLDSVSIGSVYLVPTNGNPAGNVTILNPMTYVGSTVTQLNTNKVYQGETNREVVGLRLIMSSTGSAVSANSIDLNLNGTTDTADISNIKVWYTGASQNFATTTQFGATTAYAPATGSPYSITVTGNQPLFNDTNYFWVTYDVKSSATVMNVIDGEITGITISSLTQIPTVTAPAGNRVIRAPYCAAAYVNGCGTDYIANVTLGSLSNTSLCTGPTTFYNSVAIPNILRGTSTTMTVTYGPDGSQFGRVWIDFNDDGDFDDAGEDMGIPTPANPGGSGTTTYTLAIPCNALLGNLRMRVRGGDDSQPLGTQSCGAAVSGYGEAEDYIINIVDNPMAFSYVGAEQQTGLVSIGASDRAIMRIPIRVNGCGVPLLSEIKMSTTGTTVAANIVAAKLYRTTGNTFNTSDLRQTVFSPSGQFTFVVTDTLTKTNDTVNYWLAYDISGSAPNNNVVDAKLDSIQVLGTYRVPANGNPAGNITILSPMTYVSSTTTQTVTSKALKGGANNQILGVEVVMSATGAPVNVTSLDLNLNGVTDTADIQNIKVWYTGSSSTFATTTQFGTTLAYAPATTAPFAFTVTGTQGLNNGTNYFWVTYDIKSSANTANFVDGECTQIGVGASSYIPTVTAPTGNRGIKNAYCVPAPAGSPYVTNVTLGTMNFNPPTGSAFLTFAPGVATTTLLRGASYNISVNTDGGSDIRAWIDFDDNGTYDPSEIINISTGSSAGVPSIASFTVPCTAAIGPLNMRVMIRLTLNPNTDPCRIGGSGAGQDYTITVQDNPLAFNYATAQQQTSIVAPGTNDVPVLRVPLKANGCGVATVTEVRMSTTGTTAVGDIVSAKLYRTNGSTFNTSDLRGTVFSPSGQFMFTITDTLILNDTSNYWLAYDVNPSATFGNFLDAKLDSVYSLGGYNLPAVSNPAGNIQINAPMTFVSATTSQAVTSKVEKGIANNQIIGIQVVTSVTGSPANLTQLDLNLNGTTDTADIQNIKVWYTGNSSTFATTTQFGSTLVYAPASASPFAFSQMGTQALANGTNYFWVTYDIRSSATNANVVDGECTGVTVSGLLQTLTVTAPVGSREIRNQICIPTVGNPTADGEILNVTFGSLNNTTNCGTPATGPNSVLGGYANYTTSIAAPAIPAGSYVNYSVHTATCGGNYDGVMGMWIDLNDDGLFTGVGEEIAMVNTFQYGVGVYQTGTIIIPLTVSPGLKRLRVSLVEGGIVPLDPCLGYGYGETEDYAVNITAAPAPTSYVWNQTAAAGYSTAVNWTPSRANKNLNDVLVFNGGGNVTVTSAINETISKLVVSNNTRVTVNTATSANIIIADSLNLLSGTLVTGTGVTPIVGTSDTHLGVITGSGRVEGSLSRWVASVVTGTYAFPMGKGVDSRAATINYTVAPTASGILNVRYIQGAPGKNGLPVTDGSLLLDSISKDGVWSLAVQNGLSGGTFDVTINANNLLGVTNYLNTALLTRANSSSPWLANGTQVTTTGTNAAMVLSRSGLTAYSEIGIAGTVANPLPVTLVNFTATAQGKNAALSWTTASEINNSGFEVERSLDGRRFEKVEFVKGAGNSSRSLEYNLTDNNAFARANVLYYRLKQVDFNGKFEYSNIVKVSANSSNINGIALSPNPFSTDFNIAFNAVDAGTASVELVDIQGRAVGTQSFNVNAGANSITFDKANAVQPGVYFVKIHLNGETQVMKLVKN